MSKAEVLSMAIAGFELKENRLPNEDEVIVLEQSLNSFYQKSNLTGCLINYSVDICIE